MATPRITDEYMMQMLATVKEYSVIILKAGPKFNESNVQPIIWEHARRNFALRAEGLLSIVCPASDNGDVKGIAIFNTDIDKTKALMDEDPAIKSGTLIYEVHAMRSFPGDTLP